jgi:hypothetical protein
MSNKASRHVTAFQCGKCGRSHKKKECPGFGKKMTLLSETKITSGGCADRRISQLK